MLLKSEHMIAQKNSNKNVLAIESPFDQSNLVEYIESFFTVEKKKSFSHCKHQNVYLSQYI